MIAFQSAEGIEFWRPHEIASIMPEFRNWWRGVRQDGSVAHRPTPPPAGPWVPHGGGFVNSRFLVPRNRHWKDPADFLIPGGAIPPSATEEDSPEVPGLGLRANQVYALYKVKGKREVLWHTDLGDFHWKDTRLEDAARTLPELVLFKPGHYLNRGRLIQIRYDGDKNSFFCLDNGVEYRTAISNPVVLRLGLESHTRLEPATVGRFGQYQLRDWPLDLSKASREFLRKHFRSAEQLIAHLIWQRLRDRQSGIFKRWGDSYRDFWYCVLSPVLFRAGYLDENELLREVSLEPQRGKSSLSQRLFLRTYSIVAFFIKDCGFFDFHEFGFKDPAPEHFTLGKLRPEIVLITEKEDCLEYARRLVKEFGVSHYHLGGQPSLLRSEYVAERLLKHLKTIRAIAYVDYDVGGWILEQAAAEQLRHRGLEVVGFEYLLRQDCFTDEEKTLHSHPCPLKNATQRTKAEMWIAGGGGLDGQPRGIFACYVEPYSRVRKLFLDLVT